jgi:2-succinyl-6-hydroxy-2,4-cyclohexadiene-1-carboxylate synthase
MSLRLMSSDSELSVTWFIDRRLDQTSRGGHIPVLFLHGFMGYASQWAPIARGLAAPTLGIDLPGHGGSSSLASEEPWFEETSVLLDKTLSELDVPVVDVVGYSMGGRVAMHFTQKFPSRVRKVILESSHPGLVSNLERSQREKSDAQWAELIQTDWPNVLSEWYKQPVFKSLQKNLALETAVKIASAQVNNPQKLAAAITGFSLGRQPQNGPFEHKTLFIAGEQDSKYERIGHELGQKFPQITPCVIKQAGHNVHLEQPKAYLSAIARFLELDLS